MNIKALKFSLLTALACVGLQQVHATMNDTTTAAQTVVAKKVSLLSINKASQQQLEQIPGIGAKKALAIIDYIKAHGPIKDKTQLTEVKGIGDKMATRIAEFVSFN